MKEPTRSDINLENAVKPLIAALKVNKYSDACRILFVSGDTLSLSAPLGQIGMVAALGPGGGNVEGADLIISESQTELMSIGKEVIPRMINGFSDSIASASVEITRIQNEEERQSIVTAKIMEKARSEDAKQLFKQITPYVGGAIKPVSELLVGWLYKFLSSKHQDQRQTIPYFDEMIAAMGRLSLTSPFLGIALCSSCNNYELVFSRAVRAMPNCPKCGVLWPALVVNELTPAFASLKLKNADLPVFISAYLKSRLPIPVQIYPNAEFILEEEKTEVDVYIPDTATGVECKCYVNCVAVPDSTISSEAGKTRKQIENYLKLGLTRIIVVTNYSEPDANKLRVVLKERLANLKETPELVVLGSDLDSFIKFLDQETAKIEQTWNNRFQQEFDHRVASQLLKKDSSGKYKASEEKRSPPAKP
jgi:ribosomal protein S27E